jgi:hypothetical protein
VFWLILSDLTTIPSFGPLVEDKYKRSPHRTGTKFVAVPWKPSSTLHLFGLKIRCPVSILACADRLDLGRVGITPHPSRRSTEAARRTEMIKWADGRASFGVLPEIVRDEWGIDL